MEWQQPIKEAMRKNLIYHLAPFKKSDAWQRNLKQLLPRLGQFNGQRCIAVATGENLVPLDEIQGLLSGHGLDIFGVPNDPILRERASFPILLEKVCSLDPDEATFYAHAKGVSTVCSPEGSMYWRNLMYARLLDDPEKIENLLRRYPMVGTHKITRGDTFPDGLKTPWHFAGTFYWFRHDALFSRDWHDLPKSAWATELLPGLLFPPSAGYCLTMENPDNPYDPRIYQGADRIPDEEPGPPTTAAVLVEMWGGQKPIGEGYVNVDYQGEKLAWGDSTVDSVFATCFGKSLPQVEKMTEEALRVLKPGATMEVRTPHLFPISTKDQGGKNLRLVHKHQYPNRRQLLLKYYVQPVPLVPIVVYHVACMGNWREVIREQFLMLRESGLAAALSEIGDG
ncbi:MAG: hypothetical protein KGJ61_10415, partial [Candidatus Omnitrophica bacterium]|nr:hypothetical protein [Candidatus Omnitrophota bacterium]